MDSAALTPGQFSAVVTAITSAFGDPTRREIYLFAHEHDGGVTAAQVAERFELHPNVARHHLDKLAAGGYLDVVVERGEHGGAGRPSKHYRGVDDRGVARRPGRHRRRRPHPARAGARAAAPDQAQQMAEEVGDRVRPRDGAGDGRRGRPALVPRRAPRGRRRPDGPRLRGPRRAQGRRAADRVEPLPVRGAPRSSTRSSARSTAAW